MIDKVDIMFAKVCGYISGCIDRDCKSRELKRRVIKYFCNNYPTASKELKICVVKFSKAFKNLYFSKKNLREVYNNER